MRTLDAARSLTDVLAAAIAATAHDEVGAGVWLVQGGQMRFWQSTGLATPAGDTPIDERHPIAEAARTAALSTRGGVAFPLALAGQVVAVLFVDRASHGSTDDLDATAREVEIVGRHAAKCLESLTAFRTARAMADRAQPPSATTPDDTPDASGRDADTPSGAAEPSGGGAAAADAEEHVSAQRYARLLVSEIKLYHEQAVIEGRRDRDLATRLGGEIARARVMYEQRVPPHVREHTDHFHDELVRTLAAGDATLLELRT
jgi:hypothetical protein